MPSVYHIGPFANDSLIANRPPSRNGLLSIASNVGMLGLNVVSGIVGQPITASITNVCAIFASIFGRDFLNLLQLRKLRMQHLRCLTPFLTLLE